MVMDPDDCRSDAQRFCVGERVWLEETAKRASQKRGISDYAEDIVQEVIEKSGGISDDAWSHIHNKKAYVARVTINEANDLWHRHHDFVSLTDNILASTPTEAMDATLFLSELYDKLPSDEQQLLEFIFQERSGAEIAESLGIKQATARKRVSRFKEKLMAIGQGNPGTFHTETPSRKAFKPQVE